MNLVFDFAGVLFHWDPQALVRRWMPAQVAAAGDAAPVVAALFEQFGGDWAEFDRGALDVDAVVARIARRTGWPAAAVRAVVEAVPRALQPDPAMVALLAAAQARGDRLFYLSNMPRSYADHLDRAQPVLAQFEAGLYSSREGLIKPQQALFERAARTFGVAPSDLLFFDDLPANVAGARAAGWCAEHFVDVAGCARRIGLVD